MRLHLIERENFDKQLEPVTGESSTGYWHFSEAQARSFIGGTLYLHEAQNAASRRGGEIRDVRVIDDGKWEGRVVFYFKQLPECTGATTSSEGWNRWYKIER